MIGSKLLVIHIRYGNMCDLFILESYRLSNLINNSVDLDLFVRFSLMFRFLFFFSIIVPKCLSVIHYCLFEVIWEIVEMSLVGLSLK